MPESDQTWQRYSRLRCFACMLGTTVAKVFCCVLHQNTVLLDRVQTLQSGHMWRRCSIFVAHGDVAFTKMVKCLSHFFFS